MKLIFALTIFFLVGCNRHCAKNATFIQLSQLFEIPDSLVNSSYDQRVKNGLLDYLCPLLSGNDELLIIEKRDEFSGIYMGTVHFLNDSTFYFFRKVPSNEMIFEKANTDSSNISLKKALMYVARDVDTNSKKIEKYFNSLTLNDPSIVKLYYVNGQRAKLNIFQFSNAVDISKDLD